MATASHRAVGRSKRVLLVESDPLLRTVVLDDLGGGGYPVDVAPTASEALDAIVRSPYDVIIVDLRATDGDLSRFLVQCRARAGEARLVVLLPWEDPAILAQALDLGTFLCLKLPFSAEQLTEAIDLACGAWPRGLTIRGSA